MRILIVDDDQIIIDIVQRNLKKNNYVLDAANDGEQGWVYGSTYTYDLIILECSLPKLDGISLCGRFRDHGYHMPILFLTTCHSSQQKITALDAGADDYLCKPFDLEELTARIRALLRRSNSNSLPVLSWGDLQLDPCSCQVTYQEHLILLTAKEYQLLELFMRHSQEVFSSEEIMESLWSSVEYPSEATVRSHLRHLRQKLKLAGLPEDPIETLRGRGYCLKSLPQHNYFPENLSPFQPESKEDNLPKQISRQLKELCPLVLVIDDDIQFTELLTQTAIAEGITTMLTPTPELGKIWLEGLPNHQLPHLVILKLSFAESVSNPRSLEERLSLITEFKLMMPSIPVITLADRDQLSDRLLIAKHGGTFYLKQPVTPAQVIACCQQVLARSSQGKKVMIVDDDVELLRNFPSLLQPWGFKLTTLDDPRQFWDVLQAVEPDLLVLDREMPYFNGIELCKVLRSDPYWYKLPVLCIGTDKDIGIYEQVFASGADDFLHKPIIGKQLADRILDRLERKMS
jgi:DNA-binding response OmpR family regulator